MQDKYMIFGLFAFLFTVVVLSYTASKYGHETTRLKSQMEFETKAIEQGLVQTVVDGHVIWVRDHSVTNTVK